MRGLAFAIAVATVAVFAPLTAARANEPHGPTTIVKMNPDGTHTVQQVSSQWMTPNLQGGNYYYRDVLSMQTQQYKPSR
jgi:hypothetical protein